MTNIYHVVHFTHDNSIYVNFQGCNFHCKGCLLKRTMWDCHLADYFQRRLQAIKDLRRLSVSEFEAIIKKLDAKRAVLGGGEPTLDEKLPEVIGLLSGRNIETHLLTNGLILNEELIEELEKAGLSSTYISIKAHDNSIHEYYTGQSNKSVLDNFQLLNTSRIKLMAESVLIPKLIEKDEIERIAQFIASINPSIPYRIDGFASIPDAPWQSASPEEVIRAVKIANEYLENVSCITSETEQKGQVINVYPTIRDEN